jgi:protein O-GlcNAc transferase
LDPLDVTGLIELGDADLNQNRLREAETLFREAIRLAPTLAQAHFKLGNSLNRQGRLVEAVASYRNALRIDPRSFKAEFNLANSLRDLALLDEAEAAYRSALEMEPGLTEAKVNLGVLLFNQERFREAEIHFRDGLRERPEDPVVLNNIGLILLHFGRPAEAEASFSKVISLSPDNADAHNNLGMALKEQGMFEAAEQSLREALRLRPGDVRTLGNLGIVLRNQDRFLEAEAVYRQALAIDNASVTVLNNLGVLLRKQHRLTEAEGACRRALAIDPNNADALSNLGVIFIDRGYAAEAEHYFERAVIARPNFAAAHSNFLFTMNYGSTHSLAERVEAARRFGRMVSDTASGRFSTWLADFKPDRLRVGVVSADLRDHPVGFFLESILSKIDVTRMELFAYSNQREEDATSRRLREHFAAWRVIADHSDENVANAIRDDRINILIDLSGHSSENRLPVFARKPAPVQVTWLGYFATTGMAEMDYILADRGGVPHPDDWQFTETVWYLPQTRLCFTPPDLAVSVNELPAKANGFLSFGCFQNLLKINASTIRLWAAVLRALPSSRLVIQCPNRNAELAKQRLLGSFQQNGISPDRVQFSEPMDREVYLLAYHAIDLILDTFPYPGGTTTCEALWMGVPTVTLAGQTMIERQGASLLMAAGLSEFVAENERDFVAIAVSYASNPEALGRLRRSLRDHVLASPLFDAKAFAGDFTNAMWEMWSRHSTNSTGNIQADHGLE